MLVWEFVLVLTAVLATAACLVWRPVASASTTATSPDTLHKRSHRIRMRRPIVLLPREVDISKLDRLSNVPA